MLIDNEYIVNYFKIKNINKNVLLYIFYIRKYKLLSNIDLFVNFYIIKI